MEKEDNKLITLYNVLLIINIVLYVFATIMLFTFLPNAKTSKSSVFIIMGILVAMFIVFSLFDILILKHYAKKWSVE